MKQCSKCKQAKPLEEFSRNRSTKDGLQYSCKTCQRSYVKDHYDRNKEYYVAKSQSHSREMRKFIWETLASLSCVDCGESDPACLDFDHVKGEKKMAISSMASYSKKALIAEMKKCVIRCANCHRRKTAKQLGWYKAFVA